MAPMADRRSFSGFIWSIRDRSEAGTGRISGAESWFHPVSMSRFCLILSIPYLSWAAPLSACFKVSWAVWMSWTDFIPMAAILFAASRLAWANSICLFISSCLAIVSLYWIISCWVEATSLLFVCLSVFL